MTADENLTCQDCGAPGAREYTNYTTKAKSVLCARHASARTKAAQIARAPEAWAKAQAEWRARKAGPAATADKPAAAPADPNLIDAAVQRLMAEAKAREDTAPDPRSPNWIGRDLEAEGWDRKVLVAAVAQALDDGDLVAGFYLDEWRHRKRAIRPAPTGVAVNLFA